MLPGAIETMGNDLDVYLWLLAGFFCFFVLEQFLHWHHCHRSIGRHGPLGYLILIADGAHNFIGALAVLSWRWTWILGGAARQEEARGRPVPRHRASAGRG